MGLLVYTSFETAQGIPITNVYLRISSLTVEFTGTAQVFVKCESHINREKRLEKRQPLFVPNIPTYFNVETPLGSGWNDIEHLYSSVKAQLLAIGFSSVEDVLEQPTPA